MILFLIPAVRKADAKKKKKEKNMRNDLDHKSWVCPEEKETPFSGENMNKK